MSRAFAASTHVPVAQTRAEIDRLLRAWRCDGIQWTDEFSAGRVSIAFLWTRNPRAATPEAVQRYMARLTLKMPMDDTVASGQRRRSLHRTLLLWLKACFNAIDAGLVSAEQVFLPFLVGTDGRTVGDVAIERLPMLLRGTGARLLLDDQTTPASGATP
jgi:hypothetical protein